MMPQTKTPHKYRIEFKFHKDLSEAYLDTLKENLWRYLGDISRNNITVKKMNKPRTKS